MMNYRLDLVTLLRMLNQNIGILETDALQLPGIKKHCHAHLHIASGIISTCTITDKHGNELASQEASITHIQRMMLEWHYTELQPPPEDSRAVVDASPHRQLTAPTHHLQLRRIFQVSPEEFQTWPRLHRAIYALTANPITIDRLITIVGNNQRPDSIHHTILSLMQRGVLAARRG
jgi:hypothetical protein